MQQDPDPSTSARPASRPTSRSGVSIEPSASKISVKLSMPPDGGRKADRKRILERARKMLAVALDEERRKDPVAKEAKDSAPNRAAPRPGGGAWWLF